MRVRHIAALTVAILVAGVVTFQLVTATPPEPNVRLVGRLPSPPEAQMVCRDGEAWVLYTTGDGRELEPVPTGDPCGSRGWDQYGPVNRPDRQ